MGPHLPESLSYDDVEIIVKKLIRRPVAYHPAFAEIGGSVEAGIFLSQAWHWTQGETVQAPERDGWFYKVREEWERETGLDRYEQEDARRNLRERGLLEEEMRGMPAKLWYRVNLANLIEALRTGGQGRGPKKRRDFAKRSTKGRQRTRKSGQVDRKEPAEEPAPQYADIVHTSKQTQCIQDSSDTANMDAGGLHADLLTENTAVNTHPADASGAAAGDDTPVEIVVEEDAAGRTLRSLVRDDDGGGDDEGGGAPNPPPPQPQPPADPAPPAGGAGGMEELAARVAELVLHRVTVAARRVAAEEGARTRAYVDGNLPKAARVAAAETIQTLRRNGVNVAPQRRRAPDVGRGAGAATPAAPNLFPIDKKEFAEICVTMLVMQGKSFDETIEQLMTPEGGGLTPEEAPAVRQMAEAMYREQQGEEVPSVRAAT